MQTYDDKVLFQLHQHPIVLIFNIFRHFLIGFLVVMIMVFLFTQSWVWSILAVVIYLALITMYDWYFWTKGYLLITNKKIALKIRNGFFSKYHISINFNKIKDVAYSKNSILHHMLDYGTFFARSGGGTDGDFLVQNIPDIEKVYKYVNFVLGLSYEQREKISYIDLQNLNKPGKNSKEDLINQEKKNLLSIKGIKEAIVLNDEGIRYIFDHEEDRNHGVYETIKRQIVFCVTHDSDLRDPDDVIVITQGDKVIFPAVSFHEVKQKNVVSSSPGWKVHEYLISKFVSPDKDDATILIGFDI